MSSSTPANAAVASVSMPAASAAARDEDRVDLIGLPTLTARTSTGHHQPRRNALLDLRAIRSICGRRL
jgi:hypothetical protein